MLYQVDANSDHRVISLVSRCLTGAEMNHTITEKELLAIVYSITKLRTYMLGTTFDVITDHKALTFLCTTPYRNARLIRWSITLQQFEFNVFHCYGKDNIVVDFFSLNPRGKFESIQPRGLSIDVLDCGIESEGFDHELNSVELDVEFRKSLSTLAALQDQDPNIRPTMNQLLGGQTVQFYTIEQGILFRKEESLNRWQVVVSSVITTQLIDCVHSKLGYPGIYKTTNYLRRCYY